MNKIIYTDKKETTYLIFDDGRLFNKKTNHFLKGSITSEGYRRYQITINGKYYNFLAHRLVAEYFLDNKDNLPVIHHKDGNKLNNHKNNLKWVSYSENLQESYNMGRKNNQNKNYITKEELSSKEWRQIEETQYYISEDGDMYNKNTQIKLKPKKDGYLRYTFYIDKKPITEAAHILVYKYFINKEIKNEIDHIDGNRLNNHYSNLRDVEHAENAINAMSNGHKNVSPVLKINENNEIIDEYPSIAAAAREVDCQPALISRALKNKNKARGYYWKHK